MGHRRTTASTIFAMTLAALGLIGCSGEEGGAIRATLVDGQVLYGSLRTPTLVLDGGMGAMPIPLAHVGEVVPVEGDQLGDAEGYVKVWLRNGSELVGRWEDPELAVDVAVGGDEVRVDVPVDDLQRMQTQGSELWPDGMVYRLQTTHGDDFLVDAETTRLELTSELGTFAPYLSECVSARPVGEPLGDWIVELQSGTVLIGALADDALTVALPLGPEEITVPLAILDSMEQQSWAFASTGYVAPARELGEFEEERSRSDRAPRGSRGSWIPWNQDTDDSTMASAAEAPAADPAVVDSPALAMPAEPAASPDGWFHRDALELTKNNAQ